jgi:hypothetical protein
MSCPCFIVTSGGERLEVWYNLTAQEPVADVPAIQNGDWVNVTGQLKPGVLGLGGRTFWASHVARWEVLGRESGFETLCEIVTGRKLNAANPVTAPPATGNIIRYANTFAF